MMSKESYQPFFSIIVVSLNAEQYIGSTIASIQKQSFDDYEVVVKDGCSKDATLAFVPRDDKRFCTYQIPDKSLYQAMNQAIERSSGKYLIFMNCGDCFANETVLEKVYKSLKNDDCVFCYGDYVRDEILHNQPERLTSFYMYRTPLCHQTIFFNGDVLRSKHQYNEEYQILADYDLELRLWKDCKTKHLNVVVCEYQGGGVSESKAGIKKKSMERGKIIQKSFSIKERILFWFKYHITFPKLRTFLMYSDKTPNWVKKFYQSIVNRINR